MSEEKVDIAARLLENTKAILPGLLHQSNPGPVIPEAGPELLTSLLLPCPTFHEGKNVGIENSVILALKSDCLGTKWEGVHPYLQYLAMAVQAGANGELTCHASGATLTLAIWAFTGYCPLGECHVGKFVAPAPKATYTVPAEGQSFKVDAPAFPLPDSPAVWLEGLQKACRADTIAGGFSTAMSRVISHFVLQYVRNSPNLVPRSKGDKSGKRRGQAAINFESEEEAKKMVAASLGSGRAVCGDVNFVITDLDAFTRLPSQLMLKAQLLVAIAYAQGLVPCKSGNAMETVVEVVTILETQLRQAHGTTPFDKDEWLCGAGLVAFAFLATQMPGRPAIVADQVWMGPTDSRLNVLLTACRHGGAPAWVLLGPAFGKSIAAISVCLAGFKERLPLIIRELPGSPAFQMTDSPLITVLAPIMPHLDNLISMLAGIHAAINETGEHSPLGGAIARSLDFLNTPFLTKQFYINPLIYEIVRQQMLNYPRAVAKALKVKDLPAIMDSGASGPQGTVDAAYLERTVLLRQLAGDNRPSVSAL